MASAEAALLSQIADLMDQFLDSPAGDTEIGAAVERSLNESIRPALAELQSGGEEPIGVPEEKPQYKDFDSARRAAKQDMEKQEPESSPEEDEGQDETTKKKSGSRRF